jgi:hypothetical protein
MRSHIASFSRLDPLQSPEVCFIRSCSLSQARVLGPRLKPRSQPLWNTHSVFEEVLHLLLDWVHTSRQTGLSILSPILTIAKARDTSAPSRHQYSSTFILHPTQCGVAHALSDRLPPLLLAGPFLSSDSHIIIITSPLTWMLYGIWIWSCRSRVRRCRQRWWSR